MILNFTQHACIKNSLTLDSSIHQNYEKNGHQIFLKQYLHLAKWAK
uniref:Uncharacterized protein n=1 Tax=Rhizophora mucronata TaxID=61149 RepID=A0A2P2PHE3_RHIMU